MPPDAFGLPVPSALPDPAGPGLHSAQCLVGGWEPGSPSPRPRHPRHRPSLLPVAGASSKLSLPRTLEKGSWAALGQDLSVTPTTTRRQQRWVLDASSQVPAPPLPGSAPLMSCPQDASSHLLGRRWGCGPGGGAADRMPRGLLHACRFRFCVCVRACVWQNTHNGTFTVFEAHNSVAFHAFPVMRFQNFPRPRMKIPYFHTHKTVTATLACPALPNVSLFPCTAKANAH